MQFFQTFNFTIRIPEYAYKIVNLLRKKGPYGPEEKYPEK